MSFPSCLTVGQRNAKSTVYEWLHFKWQPQAKGKFELSVYTGKFFGFCINLVFRSLMFTYWQPQGIASLLVFNCCRFPYLPLIKLGEVGPHHLLSCLILLYQLHLSISSVLQFVFGGQDFLRIHFRKELLEISQFMGLRPDFQIQPLILRGCILKFYFSTFSLILYSVRFPNTKFHKDSFEAV